MADAAATCEVAARAKCGRFSADPERPFVPFLTETITLKPEIGIHLASPKSPRRKIYSTTVIYQVSHDRALALEADWASEFHRDWTSL